MRRGRPKPATSRCKLKWLRGRDLNPRPLGYEPNELPDCSTPRQKSPDCTTIRRQRAVELACRCHASITAPATLYVTTASNRCAVDIGNGVLIACVKNADADS